MQVKTEEMVSARDFRRESAGLIEKLREAELEKVVLTHHGRVVAVVLAPGVYEELSNE